MSIHTEMLSNLSHLHGPNRRPLARCERILRNTIQVKQLQKPAKKWEVVFPALLRLVYLEVTLRRTTRSVGTLQIHSPQGRKNQKMK